MKIPKTAVCRVVEACVEAGARQAVAYMSPGLIVKATRQHKGRKNERSTTVVLTIGVPNYREDLFIHQCLTAGEPFPVKKVQLRWYKK